jgi:hypothetical protein
MDLKRIMLWQLYLTRTIAVLLGACALSVFLYLVFLMLAVTHTAQRTTAQRDADALTLELSGQETKYLEETRALTESRAQDLGYVQPTQVVAVFADSDARALSFKQ